MATLHIQNLPDDLYQKLQNLATTQNHSIRAQVINLLESAVQAETQQPKVETRHQIRDTQVSSRKAG